MGCNVNIPTVFLCPCLDCSGKCCRGRPIKIHDRVGIPTVLDMEPFSNESGEPLLESQKLLSRMLVARCCIVCRRPLLHVPEASTVDSNSSKRRSNNYAHAQKNRTDSFCPFCPLGNSVPAKKSTSSASGGLCCTLRRDVAVPPRFYLCRNAISPPASASPVY